MLDWQGCCHHSGLACSCIMYLWQFVQVQIMSCWAIFSNVTHWWNHKFVFGESQRDVLGYVFLYFCSADMFELKIVSSSSMLFNNWVCVFKQCCCVLLIQEVNIINFIYTRTLCYGYELLSDTFHYETDDVEIQLWWFGSAVM